MTHLERVAVVSGASSGIGRAVALALARRGATVFGVGRSEDRLGQVVAEAGGGPGRVVAAAADVRSERGVMDLVERVRSEAGRVDLVVHAAGAYSRAPLASELTSELDRQYETTLRGAFLLVRGFLPDLARAGGDVVLINSSLAQRGAPGLTAYAAARHALRGFADSLRDEVNGSGIRVLSVYLGRTATPMQETVHRLEGRAYEPDRLLQAGDVATVILAALELPPTAEVTDITIRPAIGPRP